MQSDLIGKYDLIYADPPWKYNSRANHKTRFRGGVHGHYPVMSMRDIMSLRVDLLGKENAALFMWCTFPYLDEQIKLFTHWGYRYRTVGFSWVKTNVKNGKPFFGTGFYAKANVEICLLGVRGTMKPVSNYVSSVVLAPRGKHSVKPPEIRDKIVELFGDRTRIELFARTSAPGWDVLGNGIDGVDIRTILT